MNRPLYNELVDYYELVEGRDWQAELKLLSTILRAHKCRSVVDLGCGTGLHVRALSKLGFEATGVDISKENIRYAKRRAHVEAVQPLFLVGSYYEFRARNQFDAALCLNWSIPVTDNEVRRFLVNTYRLLRPRGILIFDFERVSQIVWSDVGKAISDSWKSGNEIIVRTSMGQLDSNVLHSRDVYIILQTPRKKNAPSERSRYYASKTGNDVQIYRDNSYVRFFSLDEIRKFADRSGFSMVSNRVLPRNKYRRNYAVLERE